MKIPYIRKNYLIFLLSVLCFGIATALFRGVLDNYLASSLSVGKSARGVVEFFRELPGFFLFLIIALFYKIPEHRILRIGYVIALLGIIGFILVGPQLVPAVIFLMLWSTGQHVLMPVRQSFAVHSVKQGEEGRALGLLRSVQSMGQVVGFFIVPLIFVVSSGDSGFSTTFMFVILLVVGDLGVFFFLKAASGHVNRQRIYFHKKYTKYYILQNFYGARKQVFLTFGPYVLILKYGASPSIIATLMGVSAIMCIFASPIAGKIIDKAGYKAVMVGDTVIPFFVCLVYGFSHHFFPEHIAYFVICTIFVIDNIVSLASMAASVYIKDISDSREEVTATLTTGISLDHLISIFIALGGGVVWELLGIEVLFSIAAAMAVMNSLIALTIKTKKGIVETVADA